MTEATDALWLGCQFHTTQGLEAAIKCDVDVMTSLLTNALAPNWHKRLILINMIICKTDNIWFLGQILFDPARVYFAKDKCVGW